VLQDPVVTPSGIRFERATIQVWLTQQGQICPISHSPLSEGRRYKSASGRRYKSASVVFTFVKSFPTDDLKTDSSTACAIAEWRMQSIMATAAAGGCGDDDSLYEF
jgi:hypothetical protein